MRKIQASRFFGLVLVVTITLALQEVPRAQAKSKNIIDIYSPAVFNIAVLRNRKPVIVFFASSKCTVCNTIRNKLETTAQDEYSEDFYFARVDTDSFPELMEQLGVSKTPTVRSYNKGVMTDEVRGLKMPDIREMFQRVARISRVNQRINRYQG